MHGCVCQTVLILRGRGHGGFGFWIPNTNPSRVRARRVTACEFLLCWWQQGPGILVRNEEDDFVAGNRAALDTSSGSRQIDF